MYILTSSILNLIAARALLLVDAGSQSPGWLIQQTRSRIVRVTPDPIPERASPYRYRPERKRRDVQLSMDICSNSLNTLKNAPSVCQPIRRVGASSEITQRCPVITEHFMSENDLFFKYPQTESPPFEILRASPCEVKPLRRDQQTQMLLSRTDEDRPHMRSSA